MTLTRFLRHFRACLPTSLERIDRLSAEPGGPENRIKRDDCTGQSTVGNMIRKPEVLIAGPERPGADTAITQGATQSAPPRQTALAAKGAVGMIDLIRIGQFAKDTRITFLHTGGAAALFGYDLAVAG